MAEQYLTITPAGSLWGEQCVATGHAHTGPDVPLGIQCPTHHVQWLWCAGCASLWCPGVPGRNNGHYGEIIASAAAKEIDRALMDWYAHEQAALADQG